MRHARYFLSFVHIDNNWCTVSFIIATVIINDVTKYVQPKLRCALNYVYTSERVRVAFAYYVCIILLFMGCGKIIALQPCSELQAAVVIRNLRAEQGVSARAVLSVVELDSFIRMYSCKCIHFYLL